MAGSGPTVGYATLQIIPSAQGFQNLLQNQTNGPIGNAGKTGGAKFGSGLLAGAKGFAAPLAGVFAGAVGVGFLKDAVSSASDLNEAGTALAQVFGSAVGQINKFSAGGAQAFGQTKLAVMQAAQTFGVYGKAAGLSDGANAKFSESLVSLSTDLASFYNTSPEDAMNAIASGLRGEAEPLRQYGVLLNSATLKAEALKLGLVKTTKDALTPQQQVLAAQAVIMQQTSVAQGDFQRTSGGLANQQRILSAEWQNAKTTLGTALLPVVLSVTKMLTSGLGPAVTFVENGMTSLGPIVDRVRGFFAGLGTSGGNASAWMTALSATFASLVAFAAPLVPVLQSIGQQIIASLMPGFQSVAATLSTTFLPAFQQILPILEPIAAFVLRTLGTAVVGVITGAFNVIDGVLKAISGLFQIFSSLIRGDWEGLWNGVKTFLSGILQGLLGAFEVWWNLGILSIFRKGAEMLLTGVWKKLFTSIGEAATKGLDAAKGLAETGLTAIRTGFVNAVTSYLTVWKTLFSDLLTATTSGWAAARSAFGSALAGLRTLASEAANAILGFFKTQFALVKSTAVEAISGVTSAVTALPGAVKGAVSGAGSWLVSAGADVIRGFIHGIESMAGAVVSAIRNTITDALPGYVKKALGIHSPSTVFMGFGENVSEGMALGITKGAGKVTRAASGLTDILPAAPATAGALSGGSREFHYHAAGGRDMTEADFFSAAQRVPLLVTAW